MAKERFDRYEIIGELAHGGMATVFHAYDPRFRRDVALKILPRELFQRPEFRERFAREARAVARLEHAAIVPVYDFGELDGRSYLVMRLMRGGDLSERISRRPLSLVEALRVLQPICRALDFAHSKGIIHRDIKPGNILFDESGEPYLTDFGIVKLIGGESKTLTGAGALMGTPAYMSPEQVQGEAIDGRSDIYSLGAVLFVMLTGQKPYDAETPMGLALKHVLEPVPDILAAGSGLPAGCQELVSRAMAKSPDARYQTAADFAEALAMVAALGNTGPTLAATGPGAPSAQPSAAAAAVAAAAAGGTISLPPSDLSFPAGSGWTKPQPAQQFTPPPLDYQSAGQATPAPLPAATGNATAGGSAGTAPTPAGKSAIWKPALAGGLLMVALVLVCGCGFLGAWQMGWLPLPGTATATSAVAAVETAVAATAAADSISATNGAAGTDVAAATTATTASGGENGTSADPGAESEAKTATARAVPSATSRPTETPTQPATATGTATLAATPTETATPAPVTYAVTVATACDFLSGTDANVYINLFGENGETGASLLDRANINDFETCEQNTYLLTVDQDLGPLTQVEIFHDDTGPFAGWKLDWVHVRNNATDAEWFFPCARWLAKDNGDGAIFRRIFLDGPCQ